MANKDINKTYNILFGMKKKMEDLIQEASDLVSEVKNFGGDLNRVMSEQMIKYYVPAIQKLVSDPQTPGSIFGLIRFLDSLPLAITRIAPAPEIPIQEIPNMDVDSPQAAAQTLVEPVIPPSLDVSSNEEAVDTSSPDEMTSDDIPVNTSYQNPMGISPEEASEENQEQEEQEESAPQEEKEILESVNNVEDDDSEKKDHLKEELIKYAVFRTSKIGSSLGDISNTQDSIAGAFDTEEEAKEQAELLNGTVSSSEKQILGTEYRVDVIDVDPSEGDDE